MDFNDTPQEAEFRAEARAWLEANAKPKQSVTADTISAGEYDEKAELVRAKEWQGKKADAGYAFITWPKEYGGGGGTVIQSVIYADEEQKFAVPRDFFVNAIFIGPTLLTYASEEDKKRYLPKMARGEELWCQLFSEPSAGSDLAGLRTRADRDGEDWIINGQKVWTSGAHLSEWGILVTRHDPGVPKHRGMTYFYLDMRSPGVEIVPIKQISGASNFNEVFLKDVRIPDSQRLGDIGAGWRVALTTLMNERMGIGGGNPPDADELLGLAQQLELDGEPAIENGAVRDKLADWYVQSQGLKFTRFRSLTALSKGQTPGPEGSIGKLVSACKQLDIASFGMELADMGGILTDPELAPEKALFPQGFLGSPGYRIAGGTDEILRNIIGERVLGLPPDIRVDKEVNFNELSAGRA